MPTSTSKQATTIQERNQFNNPEHKKRILLFRKNLPASLKKSEFSFRGMGWLRVTRTLVGGGTIKRVSAKVFYYAFVNKVGEAMVYLYIFAK